MPVPNTMPKWAILSSIVLVIAGSVAGCSTSNHAGSGNNTVSTATSTSSNQTSTNQTLSTSTASDTSNGAGTEENPANESVSIQVLDTTLSKATVQQNVKYLDQLFNQHPGDGVVRGPGKPVYNIDVRLDPQTQKFTGHLDVEFTNNLKADLNELYFNVWANATHFRRKDGWEKITKVTVDGNSQTFTQTGSVLHVQLAHPVKVGQQGRVSLDFAGAVPNIGDRFGYQGTTFTMGNWYPILAVHDQYGWVTPPYFADGESFYSLVGMYHLNVTVPSAMVVAASGEEGKKQVHSDGTTTHSFEANGVRDVAWVADPNYKVMTGKAGHTTIYTYYRTDESNQADRAQLMTDVAENAILAYSHDYGDYPYKTLRVCAMSGWFGGMEYPELEMISFPNRGNSEQEATIYVAHETAHQWFYGMVGDDEYLTPFIDESFAQFSEMTLDGELNRLQNMVSPSRPSYGVRSFPDSDYPESAEDSSRYFATIYMGGANALNELHQYLGDVKFAALMKDYFKQYQYRVATIQDFIHVASKVAGKDMTNYFKTELEVDPNDDKNSPTSPWVEKETKVNGRDWAGK